MRRINPAKLRKEAKKLIAKADEVEAEYFEELGRVFMKHLQRDKELKDVDTLKESAAKILKRLEY